jgi:hypothetical protein
MLLKHQLSYRHRSPIESKLKPMTVAAPPSTQDIARLFQNRNNKQVKACL